MLMRKNTSLVFSSIPILLGLYMVVNDDFLNIYGDWDKYGMGWIDDYTFGIILITIGTILFLSFMMKNEKIQSLMLVALGSVLFAIFIVYLYRSFIGFQNITWIFSLSIFLLLYTSILRAGDRNYDERRVLE